MTTQEFVKKESENSYAYVGFGDAQYNYSLGLTKGLEIAKEFLCWLDPSEKKSDELLTIFLTEKYGK